MIVDQGAVIIGTADGRPFPPPVYLEDGEDNERESSVKEDVLSPRIWWWRKVG